MAVGPRDSSRSIAGRILALTDNADGGSNTKESSFHPGLEQVHTAFL